MKGTVHFLFLRIAFAVSTLLFINAAKTFAAPALDALSCGSFVNGSLTGSGTVNQYPCSDDLFPGSEKTYTYVLGGSIKKQVEFRVFDDTFNTRIFLKTGTSASTTIACGPIVKAVLTPGVTYYLTLDSKRTSITGYVITVKCYCAPVYSNPSCTSGDYIQSIRKLDQYTPSQDTVVSTGCASLNNYQNIFSTIGVYNGANRLEINSGPKPQCYLIFIDFNLDEQFSADELVYVNNTPTTSVIASYSAGRLNFIKTPFCQMRIISSRTPFANTTNSCQSLVYGETEDFSVNTSIGGGWPISFGDASNDYVKGVVVDAAGNTYVSMSFQGKVYLGSMGDSSSSVSTSRRDMVLAKYNSRGVRQWSRKIGNGQFDMEPQGVNLDGAGNVYWAGSFAGGVNFPGGPDGQTRIGLGAAGSYDAFVAKFDPITGVCKWAKRVGGPGNDYLYACFVSNSGNVYAGGSYTGAITFATSGGTVNLPTAGLLDGFIVKFDNNGNGIYASRMGSTGNDEVKSIEYNGGDLVATGYMSNNCTFPGVSANITLPGINGSRDAWAARINSTGKYVWVKNFGTIFNDEGTSICMDPSTGNVFASAAVADAPMSFNGISYPGFGGNDIAVVGWNFYTQAPVWAKRVGSAFGDYPTILRWDGTTLVAAGWAGGNLNTGAGGIGTINTNGTQDGMILRYNKTTGAVSSGLLFGGINVDRVYTMWCNTATREEVIGGVFSDASNLPVSAPRQSYGQLDGFIGRLPVTSGARIGEEEGAPILGALSSGLHVYPVPANRELRVDVANLNEIVLKTYDAKGTLLALPIRREGIEAIVDVSGLRPGIYVITAGGKSARFVKE